jgi:hypothetical protein
MKQVSLSLALCLLVQGCAYFGGGIMKSKTESFNDPKIGEKPAAGGGFCLPTNAVAYDAKWLETHWGKPASVHKEAAGSDEIWRYKFKLIWNGAVPMVIVPIPLAVPLEREKVDFLLRDGYVVHMRTVSRAAVGGAFGFTLIGPCGPAAGAFDFDDIFD